MPPTVRSVLELPGLGLRLRSAGSGQPLTAPVRWVAVSELEDPSPYLEGGELVLSTGMRLPADDDPGSAAALDGYVARLVDAGVAAFGLGVGLSHADLPQGLVAAAGARGLPLLEVPGGTPFIAVSKAVSALLAGEEYAGTTRALEAQRDLTRAALAPAGPAAVVARLARHLDGFVLALDAEGRVLHATPAEAAERAVEVAQQVEVLRGRGLLASAAVAGAGEHVVIQPLGARGRVRGFLVVGTAAPLQRAEQSVVAVAVSLLSLAVERDHGGLDGDVFRGGPVAGRRLRQATLRLLVAGADPADLPLDQLGWGWLAETPLRAVLVGPGVPADELATLPSRDVAVAAVEGGLLVLVRDDPAAVGAVEQALVTVPAGGAGPVPAGELPTAVSRAREALAATRGPGLRWHGRLPADGMLGALDPAAAAAVAEDLLAPLDDRKGDLGRSLLVWLAHHGQWDVAAAELGVHRHTLRYRVRRAEELLGRSLDDPQLRAELWFALQVRHPGTS